MGGARGQLEEKLKNKIKNEEGQERGSCVGLNGRG